MNNRVHEYLKADVNRLPFFVAGRLLVITNKRDSKLLLASTNTVLESPKRTLNLAF